MIYYFIYIYIYILRKAPWPKSPSGAQIHRNITCDFFNLVFDRGFRIYVKNCHIFDRLEYTEVLSASSCDHFIAEKEFRSQCHILRFSD